MRLQHGESAKAIISKLSAHEGGWVLNATENLDSVMAENMSKTFQYRALSRSHLSLS